VRDDPGSLDEVRVDEAAALAPAVVAAVRSALETEGSVGLAAAEPDERTGLRRLYVVLTRAVSRLTVVHHLPLPAALGPVEQAPVAPATALDAVLSAGAGRSAR
jgi:hypothetical protein